MSRITRFPITRNATPALYKRWRTNVLDNCAVPMWGKATEMRLPGDCEPQVDPGVSRHEGMNEGVQMAESYGSRPAGRGFQGRGLQRRVEGFLGSTLPKSKPSTFNTTIAIRYNGLGETNASPLTRALGGSRKNSEDHLPSIKFWSSTAGELTPICTLIEKLQSKRTLLTSNFLGWINSIRLRNFFTLHFKQSIFRNFEKKKYSEDRKITKVIHWNQFNRDLLYKWYRSPGDASIRFTQNYPHFFILLIRNV